MDAVIFYKDLFLCGEHDNIVFKKGREYEVMSEDEDFIYVNSKPKTNECSMIPKVEEGNLFEYK